MFWQELLCEFSPEQDFPLGDGSGLEHVRYRDFVPGPQVVEHSVQAPHIDHSPSTSEPDPEPDPDPSLNI